MSKFQIYVGTYGKYNDGNLAGKWVDVTDLSNDEFTKEIELLHDDEDDPEFMYQDFEVPDAFESLIDEGFISNDFWSLKDWYTSQSEDYQNAFNAFVNLGHDPNPENFEEAYMGEYSSGAEYAGQLADELGELSNVPDYIKNCIDWQDVWDSYLRYDFDEDNGFIFRNY